MKLHLSFFVALGGFIGSFLLLRGTFLGAVGSYSGTDERSRNLANVVPSKLTTIPRDDFIFLKVGKAGGGTVKAHLEAFWSMQVKSCHPWPCPHKISSAGQDGGLGLMALSVRDPIDRFVSGFYFRALRLKVTCPDEKSCSDDDFWPQTTEKGVIFDKHGEDVNSLAEALCEDGPGGRRGSEAAREDAKAILHVAWTLNDWVEGIDWSLKTRDVFPLVQEPGFSLEDEIDAMVEWMHKRSALDSLGAGFAAQRDLALKLADDETLRRSLASPRFRHYSESASKTPLSSRGEECLARYFKKDYELLRRKVKPACKTEVCKKAVQSILSRREHLLV